MRRSLLAWLPVALVVSVVTVLATAHLGDDSAGIRLALCGLVLAALLVSKLAPHWRVSEPGTHARILAVLALAGTLHAAGPDLWRFSSTPWVRVWNVFHYYLGVEYFPELGYSDLYVAALAADREERGYWRDVETVRNLRTGDVEPRAFAEARYSPAEHFTPERWHKFKKDVTALQPQLSRRTWRSVLRDRGYNATPSWTVLVRPLTHLLPATRPVALKALVALDLLLLAATFWLLARTFGLRTAALVLLFFVLSPINRGRLVGGVLQYDWFCAMAFGLCWLKRWRPQAAAASLAWATLARIFPLALTGSATLPALFRKLRGQRMRAGTIRFGLIFGLLCLLGGGLGLAAGRGAEAWREFTADIVHHNEAHVFGEQRVGLKHLFTHDLTSLRPQESPPERRASFARQKPAYLAVAGLLLVLYAASVLRRNRTDAFLLGMVPFFVLTVASRYYWSGLAFLSAVTTPGRRGQRRNDVLVLGQALILVVFYLYDLSKPKPYAAYIAWDALIAALLTTAIALFLVNDRRVLQRTLRRKRQSSSSTQSARSARRPLSGSTSRT